MEVWKLLIAVLVGFAGCWFMKDRILLIVHGATTFAQKLRAKAAALEAAVKS